MKKIQTKALALFSVLSVFILMGAPAQALDVGDTAPCVILPQLTSAGNETEGCILEPEQEEQSFTLLEFMSIDCSACVQNLPNISALAESLSQGATVRLVAINRNVNRVKNFLTRNGLSLATAFDSRRDAARAVSLRFTPTLFVLNADNEVIYKHIGVLSPSDIREIENLVRGES